MEQTAATEIRLKDKIQGIKENIKPIIQKCVFSFLISRLMIIGGISPFAASFLLATGNGISTLGFALFGIFSNIYINRYKYVLSILFANVSHTLMKLLFPSLKSEKYSPFVLFFTSVIFGTVFIIFTDFVLYDILLILLEAFLSVVFYFVTKNFINFSNKRNKRFFTNEELSAPLIILCVIIAGIGNIYLPYGFSFKNIICIYLILSVSLYANMGTTAQIAVFLSIAAGHGSDYFPFFISSYAIASLFGSVFSKYGKIAASLGFTIGNIIITVLLVERSYMVISFHEIAISSLLFVLTPEKLLGKLNYIFKGRITETDNAHTIKNIATVKLERLAGAFKKLSDTISSTNSKETNTINTVTIYDSVADKVCRKCTMRFYCWQKDYDLTTDAFIKITDMVKQKGKAELKDFPSYFVQKCTKASEILNALTSAYEIIRLNTVWQDKMRENTRIYKEQFNELSDIVTNLKNEIDKNPYFDKELSQSITDALEKDGFLIKNLEILKDCNDSTEIDITLFPCNLTGIKCYDTISESLEEVIGIPFEKAYGKCSFKECHLIFKEREIYDLTYSIKQISKKPGETNGDSWAVNTLENGDKYIALCDGSGSGEKAGSYSKRTMALLEEFLKTGFSKASSVKIINSSFLTTESEDIFSTIDLGIVDLKNGDFEIVKKGAAPTYIMRANGDFDVIKNNTLPLGVFGGEKGKIKKTVLMPDDIIVMASDGISDAINKEDWIVDALSAINSTDTEHIAETIMKIAVTSESDDDKTVIVGKLKKNII